MCGVLLFVLGVAYTVACVGCVGCVVACISLCGSCVWILLFSMLTSMDVFFLLAVWWFVFTMLLYLSCFGSFCCWL